MRFRSIVDDSLEDDLCQPMDTTDHTNEETKNRSKRNKFYVNRYKNQLMLSEWLVTIPEDLATDWVLVLCPVGKRCLVVSAKGQTKAYSRTGYLMATFPTELPGGNRKNSRDCKQHCIIDCIFSESKRIYYVLDVIEWNGQYFHDCDTEFRFFWLHSKLESECKGVDQRSDHNRCPFLPLRRHQCTHTDIAAALRRPITDDGSQLDGLLFYHKKCFYTPGVSPLVNWLKPEMVADVLNIPLDN